MPMYEYECSKCGTRFEKLQKFSDPPLTEHENCGGHVERLISAPGLQFKGSGWYITDYARGSSSGGGEKGGDKAGEKKDSGSDAKPAATKSDSKSESKSESKPVGASKSD